MFHLGLLQFLCISHNTKAKHEWDKLQVYATSKLKL